MEKKRTVRILVLIAAIPIMCVLLGFLAYILYPSFVRTPHDYSNTLWECQEYDLYFIVDRTDNCMGEINIGEKHFYVEYSWSTNSYIARAIKIEATESGIPKVVSRRFIFGTEYICAPWKFRHKKAIITAQPDDFWLWDTDEPVTLTFVCKGKVPEVDFRSGIDPIRRMEVLD